MTPPDRARLKARNLELFHRLEDLKEIALDCLGGSAPKELPPFGGGTASEGEVLAAPERISRNSPCPCGSGRKYKHCHGAM
jgi:uncharacterized protein YecA (UPF0149 family)